VLALADGILWHLLGCVFRIYVLQKATHEEHDVNIIYERTNCVISSSQLLLTVPSALLKNNIKNDYARVAVDPKNVMIVDRSY
jgi:hypothetical protein